MKREVLIAVICISCLIIISGLTYMLVYGCRNVHAVRTHNSNLIESLGNITGTIYWGIPITVLCLLSIGLTAALGYTVYKCVPTTESDKTPKTTKDSTDQTGQLQQELLAQSGQ